MTAPVQSLLQPRRDALPMFVALSFGAHVLAVGVWLIVGWIMAGPKVDLQVPIKASLVRLGKKRDDKLLPRKEVEAPPPKPEVKEVALPAPAPADTAVKIPTKDTKPEKADARKDAKDSPKDTKKSLFDAFAKGGSQAKPEELEGEEDGDPNGEAAKQEGERYYGLLKSVVKRNYDVSNTIDEAERRRLRAQVVLMIGPGGELIDVSINVPSGNETFDAAVIGAVKKAAPFTAPPEHIRDTLKKEGVAIVFTP
jgi:TonB family protein